MIHTMCFGEGCRLFWRKLHREPLTQAAATGCYQSSAISIGYNMQNHQDGYWSSLLACRRTYRVFMLGILFWHWLDISLTSLLPELTLFSPFLRKPSSPKSDDSLPVNLTYDTEVYNAATGSLVLLSLVYHSLVITLTAIGHLFCLNSHSMFPASAKAILFYPVIHVLICMQVSCCGDLATFVYVTVYVAFLL